MNRSNSTVWPPPSQSPDAPSLAFRAGAVAVVQTSDTLTVTNLLARHLSWITWSFGPGFLVCFTLLVRLNPMWDDSRVPAIKRELIFMFHHQPALLSVLFSAVVLMPVMLTIQNWCNHQKVSHKGVNVFDRHTHMLQIGGSNAYLLTEIQDVVVSRFSPLIDGRWRVSLSIASDVPQSRWRGYFASKNPHSGAHIGVFRKEADARRVAEAIADFVGVPVSTA